MEDALDIGIDIDMGKDDLMDIIDIEGLGIEEPIEYTDNIIKKLLFSTNRVKTLMKPSKEAKG